MDHPLGKALYRAPAQTPVRKVIKAPRGGKDNLFIQPKEFGPDRELVENHNRLNFANNFSYADQWTGNTRTFDPEGNYNCGICNKADGLDCLIISDKIDRAAGGVAGIGRTYVPVTQS